MPAPGARAAAKLAGRLRYRTDKPCRNGHIADRLTSNGMCVICALQSDRLPENRAKAAAYRAKNAALIKVYQTAYAARHRETKAVYDKLYRVKNRDKKIARDRAYHWAHRDRALAGSRAWYRANRAAALAYKRVYRATNAAKHAVWRRAWELRNKDQVQLNQRLQRALRKGAPGRYTKADILDLLATQAGLCVYCGTDIRSRYHVDHRMPICLGGSNNPDNLQLTCPKCNWRKNRKHPEVFEQEIVHLQQTDLSRDHGGAGPRRHHQEGRGGET